MKSTLSTTLAVLLSTASALPSALSSRGACPATFPAGTIAPSLLTKISQSEPDKAFGAVKTGIVTPKDLCTIVNLKIPDYIDGKSTLLSTCTLSFSLPTAAVATPHKVSFSGPGHFSFFGYLTGSGSDKDTTWSKQPIPGPSPPFPPSTITPGKSYVIAELPCGILPGTGGQVVAGRLCSDDTSVEWEQTRASGDGGCPVGFFVVVT